MKDVEAFIAHLKRTGRMKLLPSVLRELKQQAARARLTAPRTETAKENPSLISGSRTLADGRLTDNTGKRALLEIYKKITE
jgi:F0F1-type ATP synthase delta subunit